MIKWGLYYGAGSIAFAIISYLVNKEWLFGGWLATVVGLVLAVGAVVMAMKELRTENEGYLGFGEAMKAGLGVYILGTLLSGLFSWILFNFIDVSLIESAKEYAIEAAQQVAETMGGMMSLSEEQMEEMTAKTEEGLAEMGNPMSLSSVITGWGIGILIGGLPLSLIVGAIMKKS